MPLSKESSVTDALQLVGVREGLVIQQCLSKLRFFCEHDAYAGYDRAGYRHASEPDRFHADLLRATNRAMRARSPRKAWAPFLETPISELAQLPVDADLVDSSDEEYARVRLGLERCYQLLIAASGITDMAATKMLHLKRPRLVAISDSYVREALEVPRPDVSLPPGKVPYHTARALLVSDAVRAVGLRNAGLLEQLQSAMSDTVQRIGTRCQTPMSLSKARIIDILVWVDAAIAAGHQTWKPVADAAGWNSVLLDIRASRT
jgi:hypothetical protein